MSPAKKTAAQAAPARKAAPAKKAAAPKATAGKPVSKPAAPAGFQTPVEHVWKLRLEETAAALEKHGFAATVVDSAAAAADLVLHTLLPQTGARSVGFGGSASVLGTGLFEALKKRKNIDFLDTYDTSNGPAAMIETRRKALTCDFYLASANALTRDGVIIMRDGFGNRTASVQFGPLNVVLLVGRNKICEDVESGFARVRAFAGPANAARLNKKTPCVKTGHCMDCNSPDRICSYWAVLERCLPQKRIHVVLINGELGF